MITLTLRAEFTNARTEEQARVLLDAFRESVQPAAEHGITLYLSRPMRAPQRPPSEDDETISVALTYHEIDQLIQGLEARQYWELSDEHHRQNGEPIPPDDEDEDEDAQDYRTIQRLILQLHQAQDPHCSCSLCQQQLIDDAKHGEGQR